MRTSLLFLCLAALLCPGQGLVTGSRKYHAATVQGASATNGLIAWWKFDDGSGGTAADTMGSYGATLSGSPAWVTTAVAGGGITSDGVDDKASFTALTHETNSSITFWIYPNTQSDSYGSVVGSRTRGVYLRSTRAIDFYYSSSHLTSVLLQNTAWSHVMICITNGSGTFYVSNSACGTFTGYTPTANFTNLLWNAANGERGKYLLDDLRIYDHALSDSEREAVYNFR